MVPSLGSLLLHRDAQVEGGDGVGERDPEPPQVPHRESERFIREKGFGSFSELARMALHEYLQRHARLRIGVVVVDRERAHPTWTPERLYNFMAVHNLFSGLPNLVNPGLRLAVILDERMRGRARAAFGDYTRRKYEYLRDAGLIHYRLDDVRIGHRASHEEPGIWAADLAAGSSSRKFKGGDGYSRILRRCGKVAYFEKSSGPRLSSFLAEPPGPGRSYRSHFN